MHRICSSNPISLEVVCANSRENGRCAAVGTRKRSESSGNAKQIISLYRDILRGNVSGIRRYPECNLPWDDRIFGHVTFRIICHFVGKWSAHFAPYLASCLSHLARQSCICIVSTFHVTNNELESHSCTTHCTQPYMSIPTRCQFQDVILQVWQTHEQKPRTYIEKLFPNEAQRHYQGRMWEGCGVSAAETT